MQIIKVFLNCKITQVEMQLDYRAAVMQTVTRYSYLVRTFCFVFVTQKIKNIIQLHKTDHSLNVRKNDCK